MLLTTLLWRKKRLNIQILQAQNNREYQEDRFFIHNLPDGSILFGVFDGHGGENCAEFANMKAPWVYRAQKHLNPTLGDSRILSLTFDRLNQLTKNFYSGASSMLALLTERKLYVALLGDCVAMTLNNQGGVWKVPDHNIRSNKEEARRAIERGGFIQNGYLFSRMSGNGLQMSRSLGDRYLNSILDRNAEIWEITIYAIDKILLGSDGILDPRHQKTTLDLSSIKSPKEVIHNSDDNATAILIDLI